MKPKLYSIIAVLLLTAGAVVSQQPPGPDPIGEAFFPPELVMQHQQAIGITEDQKAAFKAEFRSTQTRFTELQWQLQDEMEKLAGLVKGEHVDEQQVLAQLDKVLAAEREIKRTQLSLVIRIKNRLTPEQQARLQKIKSELRGR
ncbi:MAG TPA: periplasmic heavy metal sensor [Blastocatellia bacterium]|nr:periplasmic heavy metal sensor [Blastocatellia bacterium]